MKGKRNSMKIESGKEKGEKYGIKTGEDPKIIWCQNGAERLYIYI